MTGTETGTATDGTVGLYQVREPVHIRAIRWTGSNWDALRSFAGDVDFAAIPVGCFLARGVTGHLFTVDADRFAATYEPADTAPPATAVITEDALRTVLYRHGFTETEVKGVLAELGEAPAVTSRPVAAALRRAKTAEAKLATLAAHNRGHLELAGSPTTRHLAEENLAIIGSEEADRA